MKSTAARPRISGNNLFERRRRIAEKKNRKSKKKRKKIKNWRKNQ